MKEKIKNINAALPELMLGILLFGIACELIGVLFVKDKIIYLLSTGIGVIFAEAMAIHMAWAIEKSLSFQAGNAEKVLMKHNLIRYAALIAAFGVILVAGKLNPIYAFLGLMGLKVGAYLQPFTHKLLIRLKTLKTRR